MTAIIDAIPGCIALIVRKEPRTILAANAANAAARRLGLAPGSVCPPPPSEPDRRPPFCAASGAQTAGNAASTAMEYQGRLYEETSAPLDDDTDVYFIFDVTERRRTEAALRSSEERYRRLADNYPNGTVNVYDRDLRMTFVAGQDMQKYDADPADFIGKTFQELAPAETFATAEPHLRAAFEGRTSSYETPYWEDRYYLVTVAPLTSPDGTIDEVMVVTQNVTERKRAEDALRESTEQLRQSQRLESVGSLAGGIAHDFNNLLTAIIGQTEYLQCTPLTPVEYRAGLDEIRSAAFKAANLTRQLLAFSRRQALRPHVLNLNDVVASMTGLLERVLGEDIDLVFEDDPALWPVEADPGQLEQVIMNLSVNARDAMPDGGKLIIGTANVASVSLDTDLASDPPECPCVRLSVIDTGHGMSEETLSRMFEPFYTTKETGKGTGLGLSTVYGIIKQSGGDIRARSTPGSGTDITILLPRSEKPVGWEPTATSPRERETEGGAETILLVEDEPAVRTLAVRLLEGAGYRVFQAGNPTEALEAFDALGGAVDLLFTDVVLPTMSGKSLADAMSARAAARPRVVFMSGYTQDAITHDGRLDPDVDFIEKPFTRDTLLRKVREVLDRDRDACP